MRTTALAHDGDVEGIILLSNDILIVSFNSDEVQQNLLLALFFGMCFSKGSVIHHAAGNVEVTGIIVCSCYCCRRVCGHKVSVAPAEDMY